MQTFFFTLGLMLLSVAGLAAGLFFGRAPLKGSCGGLACDGGAGCGACGRKEGRGQ